MNQVPAKYRVWSVFMFVYGGLYSLGTLVFVVELAHSSYCCYRGGFEAWPDVVVEALIHTFIWGFAAVMNLHGGVLLRRPVKRKGIYLFYGIMSILEVIYLLLLSIDLRNRDIWTCIASLILYTPGCVLTAVMMLQKIYQNQPAPHYYSNEGEGAIRFLSGEYAGKDINLVQGEILKIGSAAEQAHFVIHGVGISPCHVEISYKSTGDYLVTDYSVMGTCVNGERLICGVPRRVNPDSYVILAGGEVQIYLR